MRLRKRRAMARKFRNSLALSLRGARSVLRHCERTALPPSLRAKRSNLAACAGSRDCFVALRAPRNDVAMLNSQIFAGVPLTGLPGSAILFLVRSREGAI